jgi:hypothetical protein
MPVLEQGSSINGSQAGIRNARGIFSHTLTHTCEHNTCMGNGMVSPQVSMGYLCSCMGFNYNLFYINITLIYIIYRKETPPSCICSEWGGWLVPVVIMNKTRTPPLALGVRGEGWCLQSPRTKHDTPPQWERGGGWWLSPRTNEKPQAPLMFGAREGGGW